MAGGRESVPQKALPLSHASREEWPAALRAAIPPAGSAGRGPPGAAITLAVILALGAAIRLVHLTQSPPGLNQDEAANAWNAWSLLKTGRDQTGERWPLFSTRCHGGYSSILHLYWMMPFQWVGGLNVPTTRLPFAVGGVITLGLMCYIGNRMFGRPVGLIAAGLTALNPWHIQQTRWGHEASLCPLLVSLTLASMIWARLPVTDSDEAPRPLRAVLAGILLGMSFYGYQAMRVFLPGFMVLLVLSTLPAWWKSARTRTGALALAGFAAAALGLFGPLAWKHITEPQRIGRQMTEAAWEPGASTLGKLKAAAGRYPGHFGPEFLFIHAEKLRVDSQVFSLTIAKPPLAGAFAWYTLPLFVAGGVAVIARIRRSRPARVLAAAVLAYPLGDCVAAADGVHVLRSLPGLPGLILLTAWGGWTGFQWLRSRHLAAARAAAGLMAIAAGGLSVHFAYNMLIDYPRRDSINQFFQSDLAAICRWLRPRLDDVDAVFCANAGFNQPYVITLVLLNHDPARWFREEHEIDASGRWDQHHRYGKWRFIHDVGATQREVESLLAQPRRRVLFILRPTARMSFPLVHQASRPDGTVTLAVYEART